MNKLLLLVIAVVVLSFFKKPTPAPEPKIDIPAKTIRKVIFGEDQVSSAASASSSDSGAPGSADDDGIQGPLTSFAATELELQMEMVNLLVQIDELKQENAQLKVAAQPVRQAAPQPVYRWVPARTTYGNTYNQGSNCGPNGCYPARGSGLFGRR